MTSLSIGIADLRTHFKYDDALNSLWYLPFIKAESKLYFRNS